MTVNRNVAVLKKKMRLKLIIMKQLHFNTSRLNLPCTEVEFIRRWQFLINFEKYQTKNLSKVEPFNINCLGGSVGRAKGYKLTAPEEV